jgi:dethiobiotin synthetase
MSALTWLLTGTNTEVGKTWVGCELLRELARQRPRAVVRGVKPLESGLSEVPKKQWDSTLLGQASTPPLDTQEALGKGYSAPLAPLHAAQAVGEMPDFNGVCRFVVGHQLESHFLLVEGAGGIAVPITPHRTYGDLARALKCPAIVVAKDELGVINSTVLTVHYLAAQKIPLAAIILNRVKGHSPGDHNRQYLAECYPGKVFLANQMPDIATYLLAELDV